MSTFIPADQYISVREYARQADCSTQAIYEALKTERLQAYRIDTYWLIPADAVMKDRRIKTGEYVGISRFRKTRDVEALARSRGLL